MCCLTYWENAVPPSRHLVATADQPDEGTKCLFLCSGKAGRDSCRSPTSIHIILLVVI
jgi:hypothetical protein